MGTQTGNDIVETFTSSQLSEGHAQELIPAGKGTDTLVPTIAFDASLKLFTMQKVKNLGENHTLLIHDLKWTGKTGQWNKVVLNH